MKKPNKKPVIVSPTEAQREELIRELERAFPKLNLEQELAKARQRKNELDCRHSQGDKLTEDEELERDGLSVFIFNIAAHCARQAPPPDQEPLTLFPLPEQNTDPHFLLDLFIRGK